jgi:phage terminase large subunit GpA-like protein
MVWKQIRDRNEALDTLVYCFAAIYILNPNFDVLEEKTLTGETRPPEPKRKQRLRIDRNRGNFANSWK